MKNSHGKGVRLAALGLATAAALSLAAPASAGDQKPRAGQQEPGAGLTAAVDAKGKLRQPTAAENRALVAAGVQGMTKSADNLQVTQWPDGTMSVDLAGAFLNISLVQLQPNGKLAEVCVDSAEAANAVLANSPVLEEK